jgi:hypothetical protein
MRTRVISLSRELLDTPIRVDIAILDENGELQFVDATELRVLRGFVAPALVTEGVHTAERVLQGFLRFSQIAESMEAFNESFSGLFGVLREQRPHYDFLLQRGIYIRHRLADRTE